MIGGRRRDARSGRTLPVEDPSTGEALCAVADAGGPDCIDALDAAHEAQAGWAAAAPRDRARVLRRAADALERETERLAMLITLEMGKPLAESRDEVAFAAEYLEWSAEEAVRVQGAMLRGPERLRAHPGDPSPRRPLPDRHPVELPAGDPRPGRRRRARGRLHGRAAALRPDAAVGPRAGRDRRGRRRSRPAS